MERPIKEKYYWIAGYYKAIERYADHLETALARERESVNEFREANQRLEAEVERLKESISRIFRVGHNDDCIFCGIKDREAKRAREE